MTVEEMLGYLETCQYPQAWAQFVRLRTAGPVTASLLLRGSHAAFGLRDLAEARELAEAALAKYPHSGEPTRRLGQIRFHLAMVRRELGDAAGALTQFDTYLTELPTLYPDLAGTEGKAHFYRALCLRQQEALEAAAGAYEEALRLMPPADPLAVKARQNAAWVLCLLNRGEAAQEHLAAARPLAGDSIDRAHQTLGEAFLALVTGDSAQAAALCEQLFRTSHQGEITDTEVLSQAAWLAGRAAMAQQRWEAAAGLAGVAVTFAADARDARLINDAAALRAQVQLHRSGVQ
jgi:tetratricopeptide (TPR) repeat protein